MSLKLFRTTGFATLPVGAAPTGQSAVRPGVLLLLASLWIATVCNLALWSALARLPDLNSPRGALFAAALGTGIAAATCTVLSLFAWRWTLKLVVSLFLLVAALGTDFMLSRGVGIDSGAMALALKTDPGNLRGLLNWRLGLIVLLLAVLPMVWLWRQPMPRVGVFRRMLLNAVFFIASGVVLAGAAAVLVTQFRAEMDRHAALRHWVNPFNSFHALGTLMGVPWPGPTAPLPPMGPSAPPGNR